MLFVQIWEKIKQKNIKILQHNSIWFFFAVIKFFAIKLLKN